MHSKIKKFWEDAEYYIETDVMLPGDDMPFILFWFLMKDGKPIKCVGQSDPYDRSSEAYKQLAEDPPCTVYFLDAGEYSEEEMLRIIKLTAFL